MDHYAAILASLPGLQDRMARAGVARWLKGLPEVTVEGKRFFVIGGDRLAEEPEAMLTFALERGLVSNEEVQRTASDNPLPPDVEAVEIKKDERGDQ